jgi:hypothetical protein
LQARILLSLLSGLGKIGAYAGTAVYMSSAGVPRALLPVVIAYEHIVLAREVVRPQVKGLDCVRSTRRTIYRDLGYILSKHIGF